MMNLKDLKEIIAMFEQANISELDLERQGVKIRLKKADETVTTPKALSQTKGESVPALPSKQVPVLEQQVKADEKAVEIKSPMVGTFYNAPAPDAALFVAEGDEIHEGQIICIIEAMKLMNEIKSEINGRIKKVLVGNRQPVEFNQPLFLVEVEK